jgi:hypothetical protein
MSIPLIRVSRTLGASKPRVDAAAALLLLAWVAGCSQSSDPRPSPTDDSPTTSAEVIRYGSDGVVLDSASDVRKLTGAPDDFKNFIGGVTDAVTKRVDPSEECQPQVEVFVIDPKGYASGGVRGCDGAEYIWAKKNGIWQEIWGGQAAPDCDKLKSEHVPVSIAGDQCWQGEGMVPYTG